MHDRSHGMSEVYFALCKAIDTPVSLGAWLRFKYSQRELAEMSIKPDDYRCSQTFSADYSVVELLSKWKGLETGIDVEGEAIRRFTLAESSCLETNRRIRKSRMEVNSSVDGIIHSARRKIARLLGQFSLFKVEGSFGWGPGATYEIPRRRAAVDTKMSELPITVTRNALQLFHSVITSDLHWSAAILGITPEGPFSLLKDTFKVVDGCVIETVEKNAKTRRVIAKEPRGNSFLQKGVGGYFRRQLKRVGIDLDDQTRNQTLAKSAIDLDLATIDLKMASDTISMELVYELLPYDWASLLDDLRSRYAKFKNGSFFKLEKFSSMGNGFTFELETLLLWALTQSITDDEAPGGVVSVYGDDIICQKSIVARLNAVLAWAGFQMNEEKSHSSGLFYESCGKHYFNGDEVTPAYQKEALDQVEAIRFGNRLIRLAERAGKGRYLHKRYEGAWRSLRRLYSSFSRYQIPFGSEGDDGWAVPYRDFAFEKVDCNRGIRCRVLRTLQKTLPGHEESLLAWTLRRGVRTESPYNGVLTFESGLDPAMGHRWVIPTGKFSITWQ